MYLILYISFDNISDVSFARLDNPSLCLREALKQKRKIVWCFFIHGFLCIVSNHSCKISIFWCILHRNLICDWYRVLWFICILQTNPVYLKHWSNFSWNKNKIKNPVLSLIQFVWIILLLHKVQSLQIYEWIYISYIIYVQYCNGIK